jgi:carboxyl-terminal processing protease
VDNLGAAAWQPKMNLAKAYDYTEQTWGAAFAALCACLKLEYIFTEWKGIVWDTLQLRFLPRVNEAETHGDKQAYYLALREFRSQVPDANFNLWGDDWDLQKRAQSGTFGLSLSALEDGRIYVNHVESGQAAAQAGIRPGAEILSWNDEPIARVLSRTSMVWAEPSPATKTQARLAQCDALTRAPGGSVANVHFQNRKSRRAESVTLTAAEIDTRTVRATSWHAQSPIHSAALASGIGYIAIHALPEEPTPDFWRNTLHEHLRELLLKFSREHARGLVIDLRNCVGSNHVLAARLAGFFDSQPHFYALAGYRDKTTAHTGQLKSNSHTSAQTIPQDVFWRAPVAVIINSQTRGAAEGFARALQRTAHGTVVGMTDSAGAFGALTNNAIGEAWLPEGYNITFPREAGLNQDGIIQFEINRFGEGGVRPDVHVPCDLRTFEEFLAGRDVELAFAEQTCLHARAPLR